MTALPLRIRSSVIRGLGQGKDLGTPTMNLDLSGIPADLPQGEYAAYIIDGQKRIPATIHYGDRIFFDQPASFEVHILDQKIDDPPEELEIELVKYLREVRNFDSVEDLIAQIENDKEQSRAILKNT